MLANVRLVELGSWDRQKLGRVLVDLTLADLDFDIELTGFEGPEIDLSIQALGQAQDEDPADEEAQRVPR